MPGSIDAGWRFPCGGHRPALGEALANETAERLAVVTFEFWATTVSDAVEEKLGFKNVSCEVFEDHAVWTSRLNRGVARPDEDGKRVTVIFDAGGGHRYDLAASAFDASEEIIGRLLGMTR